MSTTEELPQQRGESRALPDCPYRGLMPYGEDDAEYFFGRDRDIRLIIDNLKAYRLTVLYGPSGVGKSSVLLAGVVRRMHDEEEQSLATFGVRESVVVYCSDWRDDPVLVLGGLLRRGLSAAYPNAGLALPDRLDATALAEACESLDVDVYLVLDQFEEYFLYHDNDPPDCDFVAQLSSITAAWCDEGEGEGEPSHRGATRVNLLIALREDALARLDRFEGRIPGLFENTLRLDHLDYESAREAVLEPLRRYNELASPDDRMDIEPELVDRVLDQVQAGRIRVGGASEGEATLPTSSTAECRIEAPFLQLILTRLWSVERARHSSRLRVTTLDDLGGAASIVRDHLDRVLDHLTPDEKKLAAAAFRHLVTPSGTKIAHTASDLAYFAGVDATAMHRVLQLLCSGDQWILREVRPPLAPLDEGDRESRYEVFHDVLALAALHWRRRYDAEQQRHQAERELVAAKHQAEETRHQLRRARLLAAMLASLLFGVVTLTLVVALKRSSDASEQRRQLTLFEQLLHSDPAASLHAALQAWRKRDSSEAERAVRTALDADTLRAVLGGHRGNVVASEFAPNGETILTAGQDGTAKLFDFGTGQLLRTFAPEGDRLRSPLTDATFSPDGSMLVTAAFNGQVQLYDVNDGRRVATLADYVGHAFVKWGKLRGRSVVLTYSWNGTPAMWDPAAPNRPIAQYGTSSTGINGADLSRDGRYVVTVGSNAIGRVWDSTSGRLLASSAVLGKNAYGPLFVTAGSGRVAVLVKKTWLWQVAFWDWRRAGSVKLTDWRGRESFASLAASKDGRFVAAALDKRGMVFNTETGEIDGSSSEAEDWVNAVDFSPDGRWLVTGGNDGSARVWVAKRHNSRPIAELLGHRGAVNDARFDPRDPSVIVTAGSDGTARTWRTWGQAERTVLPGNWSWILDADVSRDGLHVVTTEDSGWLRIWRPDGRLERQWFQWFVVTPGRPQKAKFTPDGTKVVATRTEAFSPIVWTWRGHDGPVRLDESDTWITPEVAVSPDGSTAATGDYRNRVILWDLHTGKIIGRIGRQNDDDQVWDVAYIPGSMLIAAASSDGTVRIWDPRYPSRPERTLGAPGEVGISRMGVSRDGTYLVTAAQDRMLRVWAVSSGRLEATFQGPNSTIGDVTFSPDGSLLAVGAADGAVHMWRWQEPEPREVDVLQRHGDAVNSVEFTANGKDMVTASDDSTAVISPCAICKPFSQVLRDGEQRDKLHGRF